jgi:hypothetical protein
LYGVFWLVLLQDASWEGIKSILSDWTVSLGKRATEALSYNGLVQSWPEISRLARASAAAASEPAELTLF